MTNKLLTLEEIDDWVNEVNHNTRNGYFTRNEELRALLTTARAYWDLKEPAEAPAETVSYRGFGSDEYDQNQRALKEAFEKGRAMAEQEMKDKPHARTIEAVIEAMSDSWVEGGGSDNGSRYTFPHYNIGQFVKSLESILKDLNN